MARLTQRQKQQILQSELWNCENAFEVVCPQKWKSLDLTQDDDVRFCNVCSQKVYKCSTPDDFVTNAEQGHCVAIPDGFALDRFPGFKGLLGRPSPGYMAKRQKAINWWQKVIERTPAFARRAINVVADRLRLYFDA